MTGQRADFKMNLTNEEIFQLFELFGGKLRDMDNLMLGALAQQQALEKMLSAMLPNLTPEQRQQMQASVTLQETRLEHLEASIKGFHSTFEKYIASKKSN